MMAFEKEKNCQGNDTDERIWEQANLVPRVSVPFDQRSENERLWEQLLEQLFHAIYNKLMVSFSCVRLVTDHEFRHHVVKVPLRLM